ncbi:hypothetical protein ABTY96_06235 [Streptomyces sp. NPDC096057]|uniref:hypothetical protein n=1 Tax=Streptomyces sp. NPDC096057 TaxID=3155543 RepID=UPI003319DE8E
MDIWSRFITRRQAERETENENAWRRYVLLRVHEIPGLTAQQRGAIIPAAYHACSDGQLPLWSRERRSAAAIVFALLFALVGCAGLLWFVNRGVRTELGSWLVSHVPAEGLGLAVRTQALITVPLIGLGALLIRFTTSIRILRSALGDGSRVAWGLPYATIPLLAIILVGCPWAAATMADVYTSWPTGWNILIVLALVFGAVLVRLMLVVDSWMQSVRPAPWNRSDDEAIRSLFLSTVNLYQSRDYWDAPSEIAYLRNHIDAGARRVENNRVPLRAVRFRERGLRNEIRHRHSRLAEQLRLHSRSLAQVHSRSDYDRVCDSLRAGLLAAVSSDWDELLRHAPELTAASQFRRAANRLTGPAVLVTAGLLIPLLPGVGPVPGDSVRILLLASGALALLPAATTDLARSNVQGALDRALFSKDQI